MGKALRFVSLPNLHHLMEGLPFNVPWCAETLDHMLCGFDKLSDGIPRRIVEWNQQPSNLHRPLSFPGHGRIIAEVTQAVDGQGRTVQVSKLIKDSREKEAAPAVFLAMHSPSLDVPLRTEIPMRAVLKGGPRLNGTYTDLHHAGALLRDRTLFGLADRLKRWPPLWC